MELYQLKSFVRAARIGNLTRAAEELHLTQPAVSQQIRALENEVEQKLFERRGRGLSLTSAGEVLLDRAEEMLSLADDAVREIGALDGLKSGTVQIGTNDSNCLMVLPEVIRDFRRDFPGVQIHLDNGHSSQVSQWVSEGRVELGIITLPAPTAGLASEVLYPREDVLITPPDHPLAGIRNIQPEHMVAYPLLLLHGGSVSHGKLIAVVPQQGNRPAIMHVGSIDVIKRYVEIGLGVSVIPRLNAEREIAESRLVGRPLKWLPLNEVGVVYRNNGYLSPAAREFLERLREHVRKSIG